MNVQKITVSACLLILKDLKFCWLAYVEK